MLTNDSDADGNPLIITAVTPATNGIVTINGGTNLTYRPNQNFNGVVTPVNDPPYAAPDVFDTEYNFPLLFSAAALLTNDLDDLLTILNVGTTGSAGGTVTYTNSSINYAPPPGFTGWTCSTTRLATATAPGPPVWSQSTSGRQFMRLPFFESQRQYRHHFQRHSFAQLPDPVLHQFVFLEHGHELHYGRSWKH